MADTDKPENSKPTDSQPESTPASPANPVSLYRQVMQGKNHYETLGIKKDAKSEDIQAAYDKIRADKDIISPPKSDKSIAADDHTKKLQEAFNTLIDKERRNAYDIGLAEDKNKTKPLLSDEKEAKPEPTKPGKWAEVFKAVDKADDDPLLKLLSFYQNMILSNPDMSDKLNLLKAIPKMLMAASSAIAAAPDKIMDTGKQIMENLQEGTEKFKKFFEYKAPDKKNDDQKDPAITTPDVAPVDGINPEGKIAAGIKLSSMNDTATGTRVADIQQGLKETENNISTGIKKDNQQADDKKQDDSSQADPIKLNQ